MSDPSVIRRCNDVIYRICFDLGHEDELWLIISSKILSSILIHSLNTTNVMEYLKNRIASVTGVTEEIR